MKPAEAKRRLKIMIAVHGEWVRLFASRSCDCSRCVVRGINRTEIPNSSKGGAK